MKTWFVCSVTKRRGDKNTSTHMCLFLPLYILECPASERTAPQINQLRQQCLLNIYVLTRTSVKCIKIADFPCDNAMVCADTMHRTLQYEPTAAKNVHCSSLMRGRHGGAICKIGGSIWVRVSEMPLSYIKFATNNDCGANLVKFCFTWQNSLSCGATTIFFIWVIFSILSRFTHLCAKQRFTPKSCLWSKIKRNMMYGSTPSFLGFPAPRG